MTKNNQLYGKDIFLAPSLNNEFSTSLEYSFENLFLVSGGCTGSGSSEIEKVKIGKDIQKL